MEFPTYLPPDKAAEIAHRMSVIVHDLEGSKVPHDIGLTLFGVALEAIRSTEKAAYDAGYRAGHKSGMSR